MSKRQRIYVGIALLVALGAGVFAGGEMVRRGLVKNYPLFMNTVSQATITADSVYETVIDNSTNPPLHDLMMSISNAEVTRLRVHYHAVYGCDLSAKNYKFNRSGNTLEVLLPKPYVYHLEIKAEQITVNDRPIATTFDKLGPLKRLLAEEMSVPLSKTENHLQAARTKITTSLMWLLLPYGFNLNISFDGRNTPLPKVPGLNQDVDEYLKEKVAPNAPAKR